MKISISLLKPEEIELNVGIITTAKSSGIIYNPELIIQTGAYRIAWQWEVTCRGSIAEECKASPGTMSIFQDSKSVINIKPKSLKWLKTCSEIENMLSEKPENVVIKMLLEQTRFI